MGTDNRLKTKVVKKKELTRQSMADESTNTIGSIEQTPEITIDSKVQAIITKVADEWNGALKELED